MRFLSTALPGLMLIEAEPHFDDRGSFARIYCRDEFAAARIDFHPIQASLSVVSQAVSGTWQWICAPGRHSVPRLALNSRPNG
jgi:dTDP-4-dehydrorhamnose 3,5-epimerase-like enzyme